MYGYQELSDRTGISVETLRVMKHRGALPAPDSPPSSRSPFWSDETIAGFLAQHERQDSER